MHRDGIHVDRRTLAYLLLHVAVGYGNGPRRSVEEVLVRWYLTGLHGTSCSAQLLQKGERSQRGPRGPRDDTRTAMSPDSCEETSPDSSRSSSHQTFDFRGPEFIQSKEVGVDPPAVVPS